MKRMLCLLGAVFMLTVGVCAAELPKDLTHAVPDGAKELLRGEDFSGTEGFTGGISALLEKVGGQVGTILRQRVQGAASVLLVVILCGAVYNVSLRDINRNHLKPKEEESNDP